MEYKSKQVITKITPAEHDLLIEFANQKTGGIISEMMRQAFNFYATNYKDENPPIEVQMAIDEYNEAKEMERNAVLWRGHQRYLRTGKEEHKLKCIELAEKYGLEYPPQEFKPEYDKDLHKIVSAIKVNLNGSKDVNLRDIYRTANCERGEALKRLSKLKEFGKVSFEPDTTTNRTKYITWLGD